MRKRKIVYVANSYFPYGSGAAVTTFEISELLSNYYDVDLLIPKPIDLKRIINEYKLDSDVNIHYLSTSLPNKISGISLIYPIIKKIVHLSKRSRYDYILSQYQPMHISAFASVIASKITKIPLIIRADDVYHYYYSPFSLRFIFNIIYEINKKAILRCSKFLVNSPEHVKIVKKVYDKKIDPIIHPNGVNLSLFNPNNVSHELKNKLNLDNKIVLLYIGTIHKQYGLDFFNSIVSNITKINGDIVFLFVGKGSYKEELKEMFHRHGLTDYCIFLDKIPYERVPDVINISDICLGTLRSSNVTIGTYPTKILQYMAMKKPIIICQGGASNYLIKDGYNCVVFENESIGDFITKINLLISNKIFSNEISRNSRIWVEKYYSWTNLVSNLVKLMEDL